MVPLEAGIFQLPFLAMEVTYLYGDGSSLICSSTLYKHPAYLLFFALASEISTSYTSSTHTHKYTQIKMDRSMRLVSAALVLALLLVATGISLVLSSLLSLMSTLINYIDEL